MTSVKGGDDQRTQELHREFCWTWASHNKGIDVLEKTIFVRGDEYRIILSA